MQRKGAAYSDYYQVLGLQEGASEEEIKRAYRRLAFACHPDRNPGDRAAEERFKEISEAYAGLMGKGQIGQFGRPGRGDFRASQDREGPFSYRPGDPFSGFPFHSRAQDLFSDLEREFAAFGLRFDEEYLRRVFSQGQGFYFQGTLFGFPPPGGSVRADRTGSHSGDSYSDPPPVKISSLLWRGLVVAPFQLWVGQLREQGRRWKGGVIDSLSGLWGVLRGQKVQQDLYYDLSISPQEALIGCQRVFSFVRNGREEKILLQVPSGVRPGMRLRVAGKGLRSGEGRSGNLYIRLHVA